MSKEPPSPAAPDQAARMALLLVVSGPSGVGKDTVLLRMREREPGKQYLATMTTRPKRAASEAGHPLLRFASDEEFERLIAEDGLLEHANVYGYHYGVPKAPAKEALARGQDVVVRVDVQGAATIKRIAPEAVLVFLAPPSMESLGARIRARGQDDQEAIARRLNAATHEMDQRSHFDYRIVNEEGRVDDVVEELLAILESERRKPGRRPIAL